MGLQSFSHCLSGLENMMGKLLTDRTSQNSRPVCSNFQKPGHFFGNCFNLRKCFNCNNKGHIGKNFKETHIAFPTINSLEGLTTEHLEPKQRILIKVCASDEPVLFLFDIGSQYTSY